MLIADLIAQIVGAEVPVRIDCYDGSSLGPAEAPARLVLHSRDALAYIVTAPGELGLARASASGAITIEGDLFALLESLKQPPRVHVDRNSLLAVARLIGAAGLRRPPVPPEEIRMRGLLHSKARDAAAISYHYDVSNDFYRLFLGPSMAYSCAVWEDDTPSIDVAQTNKYELVCRKLALRPGMRLLDLGCGWGGMALYAAEHYDVSVVAATLSRSQAQYANDAAQHAGLDRHVEVRMQDYRDVDDGPFDAICAIGLIEHVGSSQLGEYFDGLYRLVRPDGRVLNHGISRTWQGRKKLSRWSAGQRYVFPDGQLHEIGAVVSRMQQSHFEVRHVESLREHYALTLRAWVANLEADWDRAVELVGLTRAGIWQLYMAVSAINFEAGGLQIHQILAVPGDNAESGMPLRSNWETHSLSSQFHTVR